MKVTFKQTPEQIAMIKAMSSRDRQIADDAKFAFAALLSQRIDQVLPQIDTTAPFFSEFRYDEDTDPSLPVEPLLNEGQESLTVWSQARAGGLPTNYVTAPVTEVKFSTYRLDSAISWDNKFARRSRLDVIALYIERLMQTLLMKTNRQAWLGLLTVLATATYNAVPNVRRAITANNFTLHDLNRLLTRVKRQNASWVGGSTSDKRGKVTDIYISPEIMEQIREFAYNPINTKVGGKITPAGGDGDAAGVVAMPEADRAKFFSDAEMQSIFNITIHEMNELGTGQLYNSIFDEVAGSQAYLDPDGGGSAVFAGASEEIAIAADLTSKDWAYRALSQDPDSKSAFTLEPDDQFQRRADKTGFYGFVEEGRIIVNGRKLHAIVI